MSFTVVTDICEGIADCIAACPTECIHWAEGKVNAKGCRYVYVEPARCIDCHACTTVCPIEGAVLDTWEPNLQKP